MRSSEDALLLAIWEGRSTWVGPSVDALNLAVYLEEMDGSDVPITASVIDRMLSDLSKAGYLEQQIRPLTPGHGTVIYRSYQLTYAGLARAHEFEAQDEHFPPHGDDH